MARRRKGETTEWKLSIPSWLAWEIELLCFNHMRGKPDYGARSQLITDLLINHLNAMRGSSSLRDELKENNHHER